MKGTMLNWRFNGEERHILRPPEVYILVREKKKTTLINTVIKNLDEFLQGNKQYANAERSKECEVLL